MSESRDATSSEQMRVSGNDNKYFVISLLPVVLLLSVISVASASWWTNSRRIDAAMTQAGLSPQTDADLELSRLYEGSTSKKHTTRWKRILDASSHAMGLPSMTAFDKQNPDESRLYPKGSDWILAGPASRIAADTKEVLDELGKLVDETESPIWLPIEFQGYFTVLPEVQQLGNLKRILDYQFRDAFFQDDQQRAFEIIERFHLFSDKYASSVEPMVATLVRMEFQSKRNELIRGTLAYDFWSLEQLHQIDAILAEPLDTKKLWTNAVAAESAWANSYLTNPQSEELLHGQTEERQSVAPSVRLRFLQMMTEMADLDGAGTMVHVNQAVAIQENFRNKEAAGGMIDSLDRLLQIPAMSSSSVIDTVAPAMGMYAASIAERIADNDFTRTAVAIKRYRFEFDELPRSLDDLTKLGFSLETAKERDSQFLQFETVSTRRHKGLVVARPISGRVIVMEFEAFVAIEESPRNAEFETPAIRLTRRHDPTVNTRLSMSEIPDAMITIIQ